MGNILYCYNHNWDMYNVRHIVIRREILLHESEYSISQYDNSITE